ncbi:MAG: hypothetical protein IIY15_02295 [Flavobacteriales bacterium]|nr:hypothetical protein [Flavobacteriales bacterium]
MKKIKNMVMMAVVLMSITSCSNWDDNPYPSVIPPHLVQAYINPAIQGLSIQVNPNGTFSLYPCSPSALSTLKENPRAYITPESNRVVYDSLCYAYNDHNKMRVSTYYISHHGEINRSYHYQVLCKEITGIDIKTVETINESYPSGSVVNDLFDIQGLINMKEELSRSPQPEKFPNDRYHEKMALSQFNSRTRSMVALPLLFSIKDMDSLPVNECAFVIDVTFADGTTLTTSTGEVALK